MRKGKQKQNNVCEQLLGREEGWLVVTVQAYEIRRLGAGKKWMSTLFGVIKLQITRTDEYEA